MTRAVRISLAAASLLLLVSAAGARVVIVRSADFSLDYGEHTRGDVFSDTLLFISGDDTLRATNAEVTCECVVARVLEGGAVAFEFEVLPEERDGPTEKLLYVFTSTPGRDLLRIKLSVDVLPGPGREQTTAGDDSLRRAPALERAGEFAEPIPSGRGAKPVDVLYLYSPGCRICARVREHTLPYLRERWDGRIRLHTVNVDERAGFARLLAVRDHYGLARRPGAFLFAVGDTVLQTTDELAARLDRAIRRALETGADTWLAADVEPEHAQERTRSVFRSLSFWAVAGAGLLDGINPCAFATLVFFISLLGYAGSTRRQVLVVGIGFTAAVFSVYLLLGLGAFRALQALSAYQIVARVIWAVTLVLVAVLFVLSVRDTIRYYTTGRTSDALLQLPRGTKRRIHNAMRKGLNTRYLLLAALGIGATVTLFEAACTGQVYLPAIVIMLNDPALSERALLYLVIYNLLFVAPLIVVFALAYAGVGSSAFADWSQRNYGPTRILISLLFLALGALMLAQGV